MSLQKQYKLDKIYFTRVGRLLRPFWMSRASRRSWVFLVLLLMMVPAYSEIGLHVTELQGRVANALLGHHANLFVDLLVLMAVFAVARTATGVIQQLLDDRIIIDWRRHLTTWLTDQYLARRTYYEILTTESVDNPDQRIQMETTPFCQLFAYTPRMMLSAVLDISLQVGLLYSLSRLLFIITLVFLAIRFVSTLFIYTPTIRLNYDLALKEADLRFGLLQVREHGESVALYRGEQAERRQILTRLGSTLKAQWRQLRYVAFASAATGLSMAVWAVLPNAILGPLFLGHHLTYGSIATATAAAATLLNAMGQIESFIPLMALAAPSVVRLAEVYEAYEAREHALVSTEQVPRIQFATGSILDIRDLTLLTPGGERTLIRKLNLTVRPRESMAIAGMTGVGKSSLLRGLAGLWTRGEGRIVLPPPDEVLFLPQKPYMVLGSLRDQLTYPWRGAQHQDDARLQSYLEQVMLGELTERFAGGLDAVQNWSHTLSLGEQQRLGFCRLLLNPGRYVFLDEATSAVDVTTENHLYGMLRRAGFAFISVCHRPSVIDIHERVLFLKEGGAWEVREHASGSSAAAEILEST